MYIYMDIYTYVLFACIHIYLSIYLSVEIDLYMYFSEAQPGEQCDDGNLRSLDGCSGRCQASPVRERERETDTYIRTYIYMYIYILCVYVYIYMYVLCIHM